MKYIIILLILLVPCVAGADCMDTYTIKETPCKCINSPVIEIAYKVNGETLCVINNGKLTISHGSCEKLGLKHAWVFIEDKDDYWRQCFANKYFDIPDAWYRCQNCGLKKFIKLKISNEVEYK